MFRQTFLLVIGLLTTSISLHASQRPRDSYEWRRHQWLAETIQCDSFLKVEWPSRLTDRDVELPRVVVHPPLTGDTYDVGSILNGRTSGAFLIGWPPVLINSFRYRVTFQLISDSSLEMGIGNVGSSSRTYVFARTQDREIWAEMAHAEPDGNEIAEVLDRYGVSMLAVTSIGLWVEHKDSSPPLAQEVANLETFNRLAGEHHGLPEKAKVSLHVVGAHGENVIVYSIDLRPQLSK